MIQSGLENQWDPRDLREKEKRRKTKEKREKSKEMEISG